MIDRHENRSFNTETRDNPPNGGWQRNSDNRQRNWGGGQQGRNNQPQVRQQPVANLPEERRMPQGNRGGQGNGAWVGNRQGNNFNRQQNRGGGWQNQNNPPQPRPQFNQGQNEGRNQKFEATYDRIQQRIYESSGQNRNGQNQKRRKQDNDR